MATGQVIVVTGVTGSIGAAAARALLRAGHHVVLEMAAPMRAFAWLVSSPPERAGEALAKLATEIPVDGKESFFKLTTPIAMPKQALQQDVQEKLWAVSAQRTSLPVEDGAQQSAAA